MNSSLSRLHPEPPFDPLLDELRPKLAVNKPLPPYAHVCELVFAHYSRELLVTKFYSLDDITNSLLSSDLESKWRDF